MTDALPVRRPNPTSRAVIEARLLEALDLLRAGRAAQASVVYRALLATAPSNADALAGLGVSQLEAGEFALAEAAFRKSLRRSWNQPLMHCNLGIALVRLGRIGDGIESFTRAIALDPSLAEAHVNRAAAHLGEGRYAEARADGDRAVALCPMSAEAHYNLGSALLQLERLDEAESALRRALALQPVYPDAWNNLGSTLRAQGRPTQALAAYEQAIDQRGDHAAAHSNRGNVLCDLGRLDEALAAFDRAFDLEPDQPGAYNSRGNALLQAGRTGDALKNFDRAIALDPLDPAPRLNKSIACLLEGDLRQGFELFEWRWMREGTRRVEGHEIRAPRRFARPLWLGDAPIAGRTLFVHSEQGFGDMLQFCRYLGELHAAGARTVLEVPAPLLRLMRSLPWPCTLIEKGAEPPPFDLHCPIMSLPLAMKTTLETIPAPVPYLQADAELRARWVRRLGPRTRPRIGLAWTGSTGHRNDARRSLALGELLSALDERFEYHCLQKEVRAQDEAALEASPIRRHDDGIGDFADTAALIEAMDAVISVDTSVAHLAGALGGRLVILLPSNPDWRWMLGRGDSPWYPRARLLRLSQDRTAPALLGQALRLAASWIE